jgi:hypothetical protein
MPAGLSEYARRVLDRSRGAGLVSCARLICQENKSADCNNRQVCFHDDLLPASKPHAGSGARLQLSRPEQVVHFFLQVLGIPVVRNACALRPGAPE